MRIEDAKVFLETGLNPSAAYYVAGYAVECAIIACIMKNIMEADLTPTDEDIQEICSSDLQTLIKQAKLAGQLETELKTRPRFAGHWNTVKGWSEQKRHEESSQKEADDLITAITDTPDGVLEWIQQYW